MITRSRSLLALWLLLAWTTACGRNTPAPGSVGGQDQLGITRQALGTGPFISVGGVSNDQYWRGASLTPTFSTWSNNPPATATATLNGSPFVSGTVVSAEGAYVLVVNAVDAASQQATQTVDFWINQTAPVIVIGGFTNGEYTNAASVTPTVTVTDATPGPNVVELNGVAYTLGTPVTAAGLYTVYVSSQDLAGNSAWAQAQFTIDRTPPGVSVGGVSNGQYWNGASLTPTFSAWDASPGVTVSATMNGTAFVSGTVLTAEGAYTLVVTAVDAAGNVATETVTFVIDRTPPAIVIGGVTTGEYTNAASVTPTVVITELNPGPASLTTITMNGVAYVSGTPVTVAQAYDLYVSSQDLAGNSSWTQARFTINRTPPSVSIGGVWDGEVSTAASVTPTYTGWSSSTGGVTLSGTLDGVAFASGTPVSAAGTHVLIAYAVDPAGNSASATATFTLNHGPVITVTGVTTGEETNAASVTPVYSATGMSPVTVSAKLNGAAFASGTAVTAAGSYTLVVSATDASGYPTSQTVTFVIDRTAPVLTVSGVTNGEYANAAVTPTATATDTYGATVTATLDGSAYTLGTAITTQGSHTLVVTATDPAGNTATQTITFVIDETPPVVGVGGVTNGEETNAASVTPTYTATDANLSSVSATLNGSAFVSGTVVSAEGSYSLVVTATDLAGNTTTQTVTFVIDRTAPVISVTGVTNGTYVNTPVTAVVTATDALGATVSATLDLAPYVSGTVITAQGPHELVATATDPAENSETETVQFVIDETPPQVTVTGVTDGEVTNAASVTPVYTATDANLASVSATLNGSAFVSGTAITAAGSYTLVVTATDLATNTTRQTVGFTISRTVPVVTITSPPDGAVTASTSVVVTAQVTFTEPLTSVLIGGVTATCSGAGACQATVPLNNGVNVIPVVATDAAGNQNAPVILHVTEDTTPPQLVVTTPTAGAVLASTSVEFTGAASDPTGVTLTVDGTACPVAANGTFDCVVTEAEGAHNAAIVATNGAGLTTTVTRAFSVVLEPVVTITSPSDGTVSSQSPITVTGTVTSTTTVVPAPALTVLVQGQAVTLSGGAFTASVSLTAGANVIQAVAIQGSGQAQAQITVTYSTGDGGTGGTSSDGGSGGPTTSDAGNGSSGGGGSADGGGSSGGTNGGGSADGGSSGGGTNSGGSADGGSSGGGTNGGGTNGGGTNGGGSSGSAPVIAFTAPASGAYLRAVNIGVTGLITGGTPPFTVTVNGQVATVSGSTFAMGLTGLTEGPQTLTSTVVDSAQLTNTASLSIVVDRTAPVLVITQPAQCPASSTTSPYELGGTASDANLSQVLVNGLAVPTLAGTFMTAVPLVQWANIISVQAIDLAGNVTTQQCEVNSGGLAPTVTIVSPADGSTLQANTVVVDARVQGSVQTVQIAGTTIQASATGDYVATVELVFGPNTITVSATSPQGLTGTASVTVSEPEASEVALAVVGISPAGGATNVQTDAMLSVVFNKAVDPGSFGNAIVATANGVSVPGQVQFSADQQTVSFIASQPWPNSTTVQVSIGGANAVDGLGEAGSYTSTFTVVPVITVVRGSAVDDQFNPVPGVTVTVGTNGPTVVAGRDGNWATASATPGNQLIRYQGGIDSDGSHLPVEFRQMYVEANSDNQDPTLILTRENGFSTQQINAGPPPALTFNGVEPYFEVDFSGPSAQITMENGTTTGALTLTRIPSYAIPVPSQLGFNAPYAWQVGPGGGQVSGVSALKFPNLAGPAAAPPGRHVAITTYVPDQPQMALTGVGVVSANGNEIDSIDVSGVKSLDYVGYVPLTAAQDTMFEQQQAQGEGQQGRLDRRRLPQEDALPDLDPVRWVKQFVVGAIAYAQVPTLSQGYDTVLDGMALSVGDTVSTGIETVYGVVWIPQGPQASLVPALLSVSAPAMAGTSAVGPTALSNMGSGVPMMSPPPYQLQVTTSGTLSMAGNLTLGMNATGAAVGSTVAVLQPPAGSDPWEVTGTNTTSVQFGNVFLQLYPGQTTITLAAEGPVSSSTEQFVVTVAPPSADGGTPNAGASPTAQPIEVVSMTTTGVQTASTTGGNTDVLNGLTVTVLGSTPSAGITTSGQVNGWLGPNAVTPAGGTPTNGRYSAQIFNAQYTISAVSMLEVPFGTRGIGYDDTVVAGGSDSTTALSLGTSYEIYSNGADPNTAGIGRPMLIPVTYTASSETFPTQADAVQRADIPVDVRAIIGNLTLVDDNGTPLLPLCVNLGVDPTASSTSTVRGATGLVTQVSYADMLTTEVHFFRAEDLTTPIAQFTVAAPQATDPTLPSCTGGSTAGTVHGTYGRIHTGPASTEKSALAQYCNQLQPQCSTTAGTPSSQCAQYLVQCANPSLPALATNLLRLDANDQLVVFAVNHATGYAGIKTVTVPPVLTNPDGTCAGGLPDGGTPSGTIVTGANALGDCLKIEADILLYPPSIDVRVQRGLQPAGMTGVPPLTPLVRSGGEAASTDQYVQISTHWRVRSNDVGTNGADGGVDGGVDGGTCPSCSVPGGPLDGGPTGLPPTGVEVGVYDTGDAGQPLEVYCSELPPGSSTTYCSQSQSTLAEVPPGVAPLAGELMVNGQPKSGPTVQFPVVFEVNPGRQTVVVKTTQNFSSDAGNWLDGGVFIVPALSNLTYDVAVVGYPLSQQAANMTGEPIFNEAYVNFYDGGLPNDGGWSAPDFSSLPTAPGLPTKALSIKSVYMAALTNGTQLPYYDRQRLDQFSVINLGNADAGTTTASVIANGAPGATGPTNVGTRTPPNAAQTTDTDYELIVAGLSTTPAGATTSASYEVRLGSDALGIDCIVSAGSTGLTGTCNGESLADVLSSDDIVYLELLLSNNTTNPLYRFNFTGLMTRTDYLTAGGPGVFNASVTADTGTTPAPERPISAPALATVQLSGNPGAAGTVTLCVGNGATAGTPCTCGTMLATSSYWFGGSGAMNVTATGSGLPSTFVNMYPTETDGNGYLSATVPNNYVAMPGQSSASTPPAPTQHVCVLQTITGSADPTPVDLGLPVGRYESEAAMPAGQESPGGVNLVDGHLTFRVTDIDVPEYGRRVRFTRVYNNQSNALGVLGIGWTHNFEGWVHEERSENAATGGKGRYTVVIAGQSYDFPNCAASLTQKSAPASLSSQLTEATLQNILMQCPSDGRHGGVLMMTGGTIGAITSFLFQAPDGTRYSFTPIPGSNNVEGRRRWYLSSLDDGQGTIQVLPLNGMGPAVAEVDWPNNGNLSGQSPRLIFTYDATGPRLLLVRVALYHSAPGMPVIDPAVDDVQFGHDVDLMDNPVPVPYGNLAVAKKCTNIPVTEWRYSYETPASPLTLNEINEAQFRISASALSSATDVDGPTGGDTAAWRRSYKRASDLPMVPETLPGYLNTGEVVTEEHIPAGIAPTQYAATDQPLTIQYGDPAAGSATVTFPDTSMSIVTLNDFGNVDSRSDGIGTWSYSWYSDDSPPPPAATPPAIGWMVALQSETSPPTLTSAVGRMLTYTYDDRLRLASKTLSQIATDAIGMSVQGPLLAPTSPATVITWDPRWPVLTGGTETGVLGATRDIVVNVDFATGMSTNTTVSDSFGGGVSYSLGMQSPEATSIALPAKGAILATKAMANYTYGANPWGLPDTIPVVKGKTLTIGLTYDALGRVGTKTASDNASSETWTYDALNRVTEDVTTGSPNVDWTYQYTNGAAGELIVTAALNKNTRYQRTYQDGLLQMEDVCRSDQPAFASCTSTGDASTTYSYTGTQLNTEIQVPGGGRNAITKTYTYDPVAERLNGVMTSGDHGATSQSSVSETYTLDTEGKVTSILGTNGEVTNVYYDGLGRAVERDRMPPPSAPNQQPVVERTEYDPTSGQVVLTGTGNATNTLSHKTTIQRDATGRPATAVSNDSTVNLTFTGTDGAGTVDSVLDNNTQLQRFFGHQEPRNRQSNEMVAVNGGGQTQTKTWSYSTLAGGEQIAVVNTPVPPAGGTSTPWTNTTTFDSSGRLATEQDPVGGASSGGVATPGPTVINTYVWGTTLESVTVSRTVMSPAASTQPVTTYSYGPDGNPTQIDNQSGMTTGITTDVNGLVTNVTNATPGRTDGTGYDMVGRVISQTTAGTGETGTPTLTNYIGKGQVTVQKPTDGSAVTTLLRNAAGQPLQEVVIYGRGTRTTTYVYDGTQVATTTVTDTGSGVATGSPTTATTTTVVTYDSAGREVSRNVTWSAGPAPLGNGDNYAASDDVTTWYDGGPGGGQVVTTQEATNESGVTDSHVTQVTTDAFGDEVLRQEGVDLGSLATLMSASYDSANRLQTKVENGVTTTNVYNVDGRVYETDMSGVGTDGGTPLLEQTFKSYDVAGNVSCEEGADLLTTSYVYDVQGRVVLKAYGSGTPCLALTSAPATLSGEGNCTVAPAPTVADASLLAQLPNLPATPVQVLDLTCYEYNGTATKPWTVVEGYGTSDATVWQYTYGPNEEPLTVTEPNLDVFSYGYDASWRLTLVQTPPSGQPAGTSPPTSQQSQTFAYDTLDRMTLRTRGQGNQLMWTTTYAGPSATTVDIMNNSVTAVVDGNGHVKSRLYGPAGTSVANVADATGSLHPALTESDSFYGTGGRLQGVNEYFGTGTQAVATTYAYDGLARLTSRTRPDGVIGYQYDNAFNEPSQQSVTHGACPSCVMNATQYGYDGLGRVQSITDAPGGTPGLTTVVGWEPGGQRLDYMTGGGVTEQHCYDARARIASVAAGTMAPGSCSAGLGLAAGMSQLFEYQYDNRGNRTEEYYATPTSSETTSYGYDQEDRLTGTLDQAQVATLYSLNGSGSRLGQAIVPFYPAGGPLDQTAYTGSGAAGAELNLQYHVDTTERLISTTMAPAVVDAVSGATVGQVTIDAAGRMTQYLDGLNPQNSRQYDWDAANRLVRAVTINPGNLTTVPPIIGSTVPSPTSATYDYDQDAELINEVTASGSLVSTITSTWSQGTLIEQQQGMMPTRYARSGALVASITGQPVTHDALGSVTGMWFNGMLQTAPRYDAWGQYIEGTTPAAASSMGYAGYLYEGSAGADQVQARWYIKDLGRFASEDPVGITPDRLMMPNGQPAWGYANGNPLRFVDPYGLASLLIYTTVLNSYGTPVILDTSEKQQAIEPTLKALFNLKSADVLKPASSNAELRRLLSDKAFIKKNNIDKVLLLVDGYDNRSDRTAGLFSGPKVDKNAHADGTLGIDPFELDYIPGQEIVGLLAPLGLGAIQVYGCYTLAPESTGDRGWEQNSFFPHVGEMLKKALPRTKVRAHPGILNYGVSLTVDDNSGHYRAAFEFRAYSKKTEDFETLDPKKATVAVPAQPKSYPVTKGD